MQTINSQNSKRKGTDFAGVGIAVGSGIGVALGTATGTTVWTAPICIALGVVIGSLLNKRIKQQS